MSGIVGIVNLNGAPVDPCSLQRMTSFLAFRGPDTQEVWFEGPVGLGHAMLRTTRESLSERQPASLDGQTWVIADARIDGRTELSRTLRSKDRDVSAEATDTEIILHAYHVWGEECVEHLLGDFAFAIWDGGRRRLFCARDHFGVKPFYYAHVGECLVFSNTLNCLRLYPEVSAELNDLAVADFLLFGYNQEPATTIFADMQRLPAAHFLKWSAGRPHVGRYWTLPVEGPIQYKRANEYVEHFRDLLSAAVEARLRTEHVGIFMSGGLDSSTVAAAAKDILSKQSVPFELRAHTVVHKRLVPDEECYYVGLVAEALSIPVHYLATDEYTLYERWDQPEMCTPEPFGHPLRAAQVDLFRQAASYSRVALTGEGGDPALLPSVSYFLDLLKNLRFGRIAWDLGAYTLSRRQLPRVGFRTRLRQWARGGAMHEEYPIWLNPSFAARLDLRGRWERFRKTPVPVHPTRPEAYESLVAPYWQWVFESYDPGLTVLPVEVRHPIFDLRVMRFMLALPAMPWSVDKLLLREATRGILPERVRLRPKAPVASDPVRELLKYPNARWVDHFKPEPALAQYVDRSRVPPMVGETDDPQVGINLRPLTLNLWLQGVRTIGYKPGAWDVRCTQRISN